MRKQRIFLDTGKKAWIDTYVKESFEHRDAILVIPGGAYYEVCTDREGEPIALSFYEKGFNAFVLNYRVVSNTVKGSTGEKVTWPTQMIDAGSAMIYIREHAAELGINPHRVFAVGFSAGGHLCGSLATMFDYPEIKEAFGERSKLIRPDGAILSYPVTVAYGKAHFGSFVNLLGKQYSEITDEEKRRFSLDCAVSKRTAPMFLWHTVEDALVPVEGTLQLAAALRDKRIPFMMEIYPYGPHGLALSNEITECGQPALNQPMARCWVDRACAWIETL